MSMDPWLAKIYGTDGGEDLEKTAQYMLLEKLAAEEGVDLSGLPPEQIDALAQQVSEQAAAEQAAQAGAQQGQPQPGAQPGAQPAAPQGAAPQQGAQPGAAGPIDPQLLAQAQAILEQHVAWQDSQAGAGQGQPGMGQGGFGQPQPQMGGVPQAQPEMNQLQKEAQAKFEEADFLGRVMAHSYFHELREISAGQEKTAGIKDLLQRAGGHVKAHTAAGSSSPVRKAYDAVSGAAHGAAEHVKSHAPAYAAGGAGAAGLGAGVALGRATKTEKTKTAGEAAIEALANARALEILRANGYNV